MELRFKDASVSDCEALGYVNYKGKTYQVFFDPSVKEIYIYRCKFKKKKIRLYTIKNQKEFRKVCEHLNTLIR